MKVTLEEVSAEALLYGYNFEDLALKLQEKGVNEKEYIYGYILAENKVSYLESMASGNITYCDRILLFEDELKDYLNTLKKTPGIQIFYDFLPQQDMYDSTHDISIFRIIGVNYDSGKAFVRDIEYDYKTYDSDQVNIWGSDLDYYQLICEIERSPTVTTVQVAKDIVGVMTKQGTINLS